MATPKTKWLNVRIITPLWEAVNRACQTEGISQSEYLRRVTTNDLAARQLWPPRKQQEKANGNTPNR